MSKQTKIKAVNMTAALQSFCAEFNTGFTIHASSSVSEGFEGSLFKVEITRKNSDKPSFMPESTILECNFHANSKKASISCKVTDYNLIHCSQDTIKDPIEAFCKVGAMIKALHADGFLEAAVADSKTSINDTQNRIQKSKDNLNNNNIMLSKKDAELILQNMTNSAKSKAESANKGRMSHLHTSAAENIKTRFVNASGEIIQGSLTVKFKARASIELTRQTVSKQDAIERLTGAWISEKDYAELAA